MSNKNDKTLELIRVFGEIIRQKREKEIQKSQTLFAYEYELDSGNLCRIENGKIEPKLTMMWRLSEALNIPLSELIKEVEKRLGKDFKIISD